MAKTFNDHPFAYHEEIELEITSLTNQGQGVGRHDGWVVMIPFVIPGERVRARVYRNHANYSEADPVEILTPSPDRIEPVCPLFTECGGCQYQHLDYARQLEWKSRQVAELFQRMAGMEVPVQPALPSPLTYHYRSKITPHFKAPKQGKIGEIGFLRQGQRQRLIDVPACPLATGAINAALPRIRERVRAEAASHKRGGTLLLRDASGGVETNPKRIITEKVGDLTFQFPAGEFFQNNPSILPALIDDVMREAQGPGITHLLDAYCGSGLFTLHGARHFEQVVGIEISEASIQWARKNAKTNALANVRLEIGDAAALFARVDFPADKTTVIIDPPRKGSTDDFLAQLFQYRPARVVYVSCNPATQIRDLKVSREAGYRITRVQPFDLFPQTKHLECVATLVREDET